MIAPTLTTARLTLGPLTPAHLPAFVAFCASTHSRFVGGPAPFEDAWEGAALAAGQWSLRGYGYFWVTETATGQPVGRVGVNHPAHRSEPELAWTIYEDHVGRGYATEAALAVRDWAAATLPALGPLASFISEDNAASVRVAEKLQARREGPDPAAEGHPVTIWRQPIGGAT